MKLFLLTISATGCLILLTPQLSLARSSETAANQMTSIPSDARFTIIQSELGPRWTFRLDRHTGVVYQLWILENENSSWERMRIEGLPTINNPLRPRFVLFTSGMGPRWTFLMDTSTGKTWILAAHEVQTAESETTTPYAWQLIEDN